MDDLIEKLSNLRSQFNCFNENERDAYHILSEAIKALSERPEPCEDAVSRRAAVDHFRYIVEATDTKKPYNEGFVDGLEFCISHLSTMPFVTPKPEQRWISVSERLPEDDTEVFVYLFDRQSPYIAWVCDGCWFTEEFQVEKENYPKAWCELPEPYKERREE